MASNLLRFLCIDQVLADTPEDSVVGFLIPAGRQVDLYSDRQPDITKSGLHTWRRGSGFSRAMGLSLGTRGFPLFPSVAITCPCFIPRPRGVTLPSET